MRRVMYSLSTPTFISTPVFSSTASRLSQPSPFLPRTCFTSPKNRATSLPKTPYTQSRLTPHATAAAPGKANQSPPLSSSPGDEGRRTGIRINKCFTSFASRRESDAFVMQQRVKVNGEIAHAGTRVQDGDVVQLDGNEIDWQRLTVGVSVDDFVYLKHWKASDTICTTDTSIEHNIIDEIATFDFGDRHPRKDRIFPVGRLDQASTGIILLTSDGRLPNAVLGASKQDCEKTYLVTPDMYVTDQHMLHLQKGIVIRTVAQRDGNVRKPYIGRSLPCKIRRANGMDLVVTLTEGRNRQIRKMLGALGYTARAIHRLSFMGITLSGLSSPGETCPLNEEELNIVKSKL